MELNLMLLLLSAFVKAVTLIAISVFLLNKWLKQSQRYATDFPLLMAITFILYALGKFVDMYLYYRFSETPNLAELNDPDAFMFAKIRFMISPIMVVIPYFILMMVIWFEGRPKLQLGLGSVWAVLSIGAILSAQTLPQLYLLNSLIAMVPILLSIVTYLIINHQRKLPEINCLVLAIGWGLFVVAQFLRSSWLAMGTGVWGLAWVGELVELGTLVIIAVGFTIPAFYDKERKNQSVVPLEYMDKTLA
jgi:hypothetical protein